MFQKLPLNFCDTLFQFNYCHILFQKRLRMGRDIAPAGSKALRQNILKKSIYAESAACPFASCAILMLYMPVVLLLLCHKTRSRRVGKAVEALAAFVRR
jgi:hypothetical protein